MLETIFDQKMDVAFLSHKNEKRLENTGLIISKEY